MRTALAFAIIFLFQNAHLTSQTAPDLPNPPAITGVNGWVPLMVVAPKYFGPNALPVAESMFASVDTLSDFELRAVKQDATGDRTRNLYARFNFVILPKVISVEFSAMAIEHYEMSVARRIYVNAWHGKGKGTTTGDIGVTTAIQVVRNKKFPDVALRLNFRTVGGEMLEDARYCDAPGYFFDATFGKDFKLNFSFLEKIRPYVSGGFYCWQTYKFKHIQDDAPMGNAGINLYAKKIRLNAETAGYYGYENTGDRPLLFRTNLNYDTKKVTYRIGFEEGLHDYDFTTFYIGAAYHFDISTYMKSLASN